MSAIGFESVILRKKRNFAKTSTRADLSGWPILPEVTHFTPSPPFSTNFTSDFFSCLVSFQGISSDIRFLREGIDAVKKETENQSENTNLASFYFDAHPKVSQTTFISLLSILMLIQMSVRQHWYCCFLSWCSSEGQSDNIYIASFYFDAHSDVSQTKLILLLSFWMLIRRSVRQH